MIFENCVMIFQEIQDLTKSLSFNFWTTHHGRGR